MLSKCAASVLLGCMVALGGCSGSPKPEATPVTTTAPTVTKAAPTLTPNPPTPTSHPTDTATPAPTATPIPRDLVAVLKVNSGTGEYRLVETETWVAVKQSDGLAVGDRVRTGPGSVLAVTFKDGSVLILEQETELEIQSFSMTKLGDRVVSRVSRVATIKGTISGDVRDDLVYPPSVFEIVTTGEIITIKGTLKE